MKKQDKSNQKEKPKTYKDIDEQWEQVFDLLKQANEHYETLRDTSSLKFRKRKKLKDLCGFTLGYVNALLKTLFEDISKK